VSEKTARNFKFSEHQNSEKFASSEAELLSRLRQFKDLVGMKNV
jgi:hypothetical protein